MGKEIPAITTLTAFEPPVYINPDKDATAKRRPWTPLKKLVTTICRHGRHGHHGTRGTQGTHGLKSNPMAQHVAFEILQVDNQVLATATGTAITVTDVPVPVHAAPVTTVEVPIVGQSANSTATDGPGGPVDPVVIPLSESRPGSAGETEQQGILEDKVTGALNGDGGPDVNVGGDAIPGTSKDLSGSITPVTTTTTMTTTTVPSLSVSMSVSEPETGTETNNVPGNNLSLPTKQQPTTPSSPLKNEDKHKDKDTVAKTDSAVVLPEPSKVPTVLCRVNNKTWDLPVEVAEQFQWYKKSHEELVTRLHELRRTWAFRYHERIVMHYELLLGNITSLIRTVLEGHLGHTADDIQSIARRDYKPSLKVKAYAALEKIPNFQLALQFSGTEEILLHRLVLDYLCQTVLEKAENGITPELDNIMKYVVQGHEMNGTQPSYSLKTLVTEVYQGYYTSGEHRLKAMYVQNELSNGIRSLLQLFTEYDTRHNRIPHHRRNLLDLQVAEVASATIQLHELLKTSSAHEGFSRRLPISKDKHGWSSSSVFSYQYHTITFYDVLTGHPIDTPDFARIKERKVKHRVVLSQFPGIYSVAYPEDNPYSQVPGSQARVRRAAAHEAAKWGERQLFLEKVWLELSEYPENTKFLPKCGNTLAAILGVPP